MTKSRVILTDEFAKSAPAPARSDRRYRDAECPALGLRVRANGKKSWLQLTSVGRTVRSRAIGDPATMSASQARAIAAGEVKPSAAPSVSAFAETFLADWKPRWAPSTEYSARLAVERFIRPAFGERAIDEIRRPDVIKLLASLGENSSSADLACTTVSRMMAHAEALGLRPDNSNPAAGLRRRKSFRTRYLSAEEYARLWRALSDFETQFPTETVILRLLLFTGARKSEIAALRWSEIDGARLRLERAKCGPRTIWLSRQARAILDDYERPSDSEFVFARDTKKGRIDQELDGAWRRIRAHAQLEDVRLHDLRHSFASIAAAENENLKVIGALLGHRDVDSTLGYAHLGEGSIAAACERNVARLSQMLGDVERAARAPKHGRGALRVARPTKAA